MRNIMKKMKKLFQNSKKVFKTRKKLLMSRKNVCTTINERCYNVTEKEESYMVTVYDVARYILSCKGSMTTMKLEKLVYYSQAWSLAWDGVPLFDDDFQAWANGPVCPALFKSHKGKFIVSEADYTHLGDKDKLGEEAVETINAVLDYYGDKSPQWLSDLTHQERPWKEARQGVPTGERSENIVSKEVMQEYYGGLH